MQQATQFITYCHFFTVRHDVEGVVYGSMLSSTLWHMVGNGLRLLSITVTNTVSSIKHIVTLYVNILMSSNN